MVTKQIPNLLRTGFDSLRSREQACPALAVAFGR